VLASLSSELTNSTAFLLERDELKISAFSSYESTHCLIERSTGRRVREAVRAA
jgi:hypothetical protein